MEQRIEKENIESDILIDLLKRAKIGDTHHTSLDNVTKGFPKRQQKLAKKVAKNLINRGILHRHPTSHASIKISINPKCIKYIINLTKVKEKMQDEYTLKKFRKYLKN